MFFRVKRFCLLLSFCRHRLLCFHPFIRRRQKIDCVPSHDRRCETIQVVVFLYFVICFIWSKHVPIKFLLTCFVLLFYWRTDFTLNVFLKLKTCLKEFFFFTISSNLDEDGWENDLVLNRITGFQRPRWHPGYKKIKLWLSEVFTKLNFQSKKIIHRKCLYW